GIEYGDVQLIAEAWQLQRDVLGLSVGETAEVFSAWNLGVLESYLIGITAEILAFRDEDGEPLVEKILDSAGQKGTGKWTGISALELGMPVSLIVEAVFARCLSALKPQREKAQVLYGLPVSDFGGDRTAVLADMELALYAAKLISYAQGFMLMREASQTHGWQLNYGDIALVWRGGCIIRSRFLDAIKAAYDRNPELENLLLDEFFVRALTKADPHWRSICELGILSGIPLPAMSSALAFFDGYRRGRLPANLIQAQRDYFGAHTYQRIDQDPVERFHTDWTGRGGSAQAGQHDA
ncbi:MAG TPA: NADP-dependent phosphogluconate dehydrogenase, partial [Chromatiaceae bacterium]|nr:NADP-dependent phosphogluconate dehydrogenase [Chromatiaceae bacterium]